MSDNTVRLIGYYDRAPFVCLVTEFCARGTLAAFAARNRALCRALARRFTLELGLLFFENCPHITVLHHPQHNTTQHTENAVRIVHRRGFLHRDIKPENCFICPDNDSFQLKLGFVTSFPNPMAFTHLMTNTPKHHTPQTETLDTRRAYRRRRRRCAGRTHGRRRSSTAARARRPRATCTASASSCTSWPRVPPRPSPAARPRARARGTPRGPPSSTRVSRATPPAAPPTTPSSPSSPASQTSPPLVLLQLLFIHSLGFHCYHHLWWLLTCTLVLACMFRCLF